ncbi:hypothetical protein [Iodobacter ciconiae]|uniref:Lipoprotein n=1 Tax=Iodobacter ciconiae TaxID=2496266 RepID=A0A3S8ZRV3_9NEIS|nr:hypothetical protein [Iodobacter ciconiae]AZN36219.1 hypothetical protein EJO50_06820 [Iodobacter ciconiae]
MKKSLFVASLASILLVGCASIAVTDDAIVKNTSMAIGLEKNAFTISDRENDGITTTYKVKTKAGENYSCYVTGVISMIGRNVSDAMCTEMGAGAKSSTKSNNSCNALLKAAGKCK